MKSKKGKFAPINLQNRQRVHLREKLTGLNMFGIETYHENCFFGWLGKETTTLWNMK